MRIPVHSVVTFMLLCGIELAGSASGRNRMVPYTFEMQQLTEADSLVRTGNYEAGKMRYLKLRETKSTPTIAARAQFSLASVYVHFDNPFADYDAALREFKTYATLYPDHEHIDNAFNWIRMLTAMKEFADGYELSAGRLKVTQQKQSSAVKNYTTLQEAYLACDSRNDSLKQVADSLKTRIRILEGVIDKLDKIR